MPELPEVESIRLGLLRVVKGLGIKDIRIIDARVIRGISGNAFRRKLSGRVIKDISRRGKALIFDLNGLCLVVQPMMTGQMIAGPQVREDRLCKATKVVFSLSGGKQVLYNDQRVFGRLQIVSQACDLDYIRRLGPEPLDPGFTAGQLGARFKGRKSPIKSALLDGKCVAGIGNIYAAESLFRAGIDPRRRAVGLKRAEVARLHSAIQGVLREALAMGGTTIRNYLGSEGQKGKFQELMRVYGREKQPCCHCGGPIRRIVQAQRSTFYCPACQD